MTQKNASGTASDGWRRPRAPVATWMARLLALTGLAMLLVDQPVARWVTSLPPWLKALAIEVSEATSPVYVLPLLLGIAIATRTYARRNRTVASVSDFFELSSGVAALLTSLLIKTMIGRARPSALGGDGFLFKPLAFEDAFASLPSTQAAVAAATTCSAAIRFPQYRAGLLGLGALICSARVIAGEHWTSDVIAGWGLGGLLALLLFRVFCPSPLRSDGAQTL